jgi:hypothetical protein
MSMRDRRIRNECELLVRLAERNAGVLHVYEWHDGPGGARFQIRLEQTRGLVRSGGELIQAGGHAATLILPRFFPSVPIEALLPVPVFHPNVEPESGFVCLWDRSSPGNTIIQAVYRLQRMIAWDVLTLQTDHVMQPEAAVWYENRNRGVTLPLEFRAISGYEALAGENLNGRASGPGLRNRLSPI